MSGIAAAIMSSNAMAPGTATPGAIPGVAAGDPMAPPAFTAPASDPAGSYLVGATSLMSPVRRTPRYGPGLFNGPLVGAPHSVPGAAAPPRHDAEPHRKPLEPGHESPDALSGLEFVRTQAKPARVVQFEAADAYRRIGASLPDPSSFEKVGAAGEPRAVLAAAGPIGTGGAQVASSFGMPHHEVAHANQGASYVGGRVGGARWIPRNLVSPKRRAGNAQNRNCNPSVDPRTGRPITPARAAFIHAKREIRAGLRTTDGHVVRGGRTYENTGEVPLLDPGANGAGGAPIDIQPSARVGMSPPAPAAKGQIPSADLSGLHSSSQGGDSQLESVPKLREADLSEGLRLAGQGRLLSPLLQGRRSVAGCLQMREIQAFQANRRRVLTEVADRLPGTKSSNKNAASSGPGRQAVLKAPGNGRHAQAPLYRLAASSIVAERSRRRGQDDSDQDGACLVPDRYPTRPGAESREIEGTERSNAQPSGGALESASPSGKTRPMPTSPRAPFGQTPSAAQSGASTRRDEFAGLLTPQIPGAATAQFKPPVPRGKPIVGPRGKGGGASDALWLNIFNTAERADTARRNARRFAGALQMALRVYADQLGKSHENHQAAQTNASALSDLQVSLSELGNYRESRNPDFARRREESQKLLGMFRSLEAQIRNATADESVAAYARSAINDVSSGLAQFLRAMTSESAQLQRLLKVAGSQDGETALRRIREARRRAQKAQVRQQRSEIRRSRDRAYLTRQFARTRDAEIRYDKARARAWKYRHAQLQDTTPAQYDEARFRADYYDGVATRAAAEASDSRRFLIHNSLTRVPGYRKWVHEKRAQQQYAQARRRRIHRDLDRETRKLAKLKIQLEAANRRFEQRKRSMEPERDDAEPPGGKHGREETESNGLDQNRLDAIDATITSLQKKIGQAEDRVRDLSDSLMSPFPPVARPDPSANTKQPADQENGASPAHNVQTPDHANSAGSLLSPALRDALKFRVAKLLKLGRGTEAGKRFERHIQKTIEQLALSDLSDIVANLANMTPYVESLSNARFDPALTEAQRHQAAADLDAALKTAQQQVDRALAAAMAADTKAAWKAYWDAVAIAQKLQRLQDHPCEASSCASVKAACEAECYWPCVCTPKPVKPEDEETKQPPGANASDGDSAGSGEGEGVDNSKSDEDKGGEQDEGDSEKKKSEDVAGGQGTSTSGSRQIQQPRVGDIEASQGTESPKDSGESGGAVQPEGNAKTDEQKKREEGTLQELDVVDAGTGGAADSSADGVAERRSVPTVKKPPVDKGDQAHVGRHTQRPDHDSPGVDELWMTLSSSVAQLTQDATSWVGDLVEMSEHLAGQIEDVMKARVQRVLRVFDEAQEGLERAARSAKLTAEYIEAARMQEAAEARIRFVRSLVSRKTRKLADAKKALDDLKKRRNDLAQRVRDINAKLRIRQIARDLPHSLRKPIFKGRKKDRATLEVTVSAHEAGTGPGWLERAEVERLYVERAQSIAEVRSLKSWERSAKKYLKSVESQRGHELTGARTRLEGALDLELQQIRQINLDRMARGLKGRSAAEIARETERLQMRFRWAQQLALYALDASYAISLAEKEGSGGFGFVRRQFFYHRNPAVKRAAKLVDSVRQFQPFLASQARWTGRIDADPTPDFQNDSPAKIWHAFQSWNAFMTEMYTDTGEVRKELFWRDEIASTAFTFAQITGALAGVGGIAHTIRTGGWIAGARAVGTDLAVGAGSYTLFREGSMALGLQESRDWDWGEFAIGTLTGAGLSAFGRATKIASGRLATRAAGVTSSRSGVSGAVQAPPHTLTTPPGTVGPPQHVFWSGPGARDAARAFARANRGVILDDTVAGRALTAAERFLPDRVTQPAWKYLSRRFAQSAAGEVPVFHGFKVRVESTWATTEYGILARSPRVSGIVYRVVTPEGTVVLAP